MCVPLDGCVPAAGMYNQVIPDQMVDGCYIVCAFLSHTDTMSSDNQSCLQEEAFSTEGEVQADGVQSTAHGGKGSVGDVQWYYCLL